MAFDISLWKTKTGQEALSFLGIKIWTKITHSTKNVKTTAFFSHGLKREILSNRLVYNKTSKQISLNLKQIFQIIFFICSVSYFFDANFLFYY